jgi:hypothetical protein
MGAPLAGTYFLGLFGSLANDIVSEFFRVLSGWFAGAAGWFLHLVGTTLSSTTTPPVSSRWFLAEERVLFSIAAPIALLALVVAVLHAVVRGDLSALWRTVLLRLPIAVLLGAGAAGLVSLALSATDQLSRELATGTGTSLSSSMHELAAVAGGSGTVPGAVAFLVGVLVVFGALVVWFELVVRAAAITVITAALPLLLAASLWGPAVTWVRRAAETLGALIISKALIVLVLVVALGAVAHTGEGAAGALTGAAMLALASFAPYAVLRLVPIADGAAVGHLEGLRHRAQGAGAMVAKQGSSIALAAAGAPSPSIDPIGSNPIPMAEGTDEDIFKGTSLDPAATFKRGRLPVVSVPASAGKHVWERDEFGPRLVWKPPWHVDGS